MTTVVVLIGLVLSGCNQTEKAPPVMAPSVAEQKSALWQTDYNAALKQAAAENKYVLVSISGLEWCGWCKALESEVFSKTEFIAYAKDNLICVLLDFNHSGRATNAEFAKQHEMLLEKFKIEGFPTVLILNPQGKGIVRDGYQPGGPAKYVEFIKGVITADKAK